MNLHITAHLPSNRTPIAGQKVSFNFLKKSKNKRNKILLCIANDFERIYENNEFINSFYYCKIIYLNKFQRLLNHLLGFNFPVKCSARYFSNGLNVINEIISTYNVNKVTLEFTSIYCYYNYIKCNFPNIKITFVAHDISFQSMERRAINSGYFKKLFYTIESNRLKKMELSLFRDNLVTVLSEKDKKLLIDKGVHDKNILVKYPILDPWLKNVSRKNIKKQTILFVGALHRPENHDSLIWFIEKIFSKLIIEYPKIKVLIVGKGAKKSLLKYKSENIIFLGFVQSLVDIFSSVDLAISPIQYGAGIKIKTLEYINAKIPTVSTEIGAEGISNNQYLHIANSPKTFKDAIENLIN